MNAGNCMSRERRGGTEENSETRGTSVAKEEGEDREHN